MSTEAFTHDVFLSHRAKDKAVVRPLAERLQVAMRQRLKLWFDEWEIKSGWVKPGRRSSRRESAQTSVRPDQRMSGLTSAATTQRKLEEGLEHFRLAFQPSAFSLQPLVCAFGSDPDWSGLEAGTCGRGNLPFRDPLNQEPDARTSAFSIHTSAFAQRLPGAIPLHQLAPDGSLNTFYA